MINLKVINNEKHKKEEKIEKPSEVIDRYWLIARREKGHYPKSTENSGKWLIFVHQKKVDEIWEIIKKATKEGKLGSSSKVATAKPNPNTVHRKTKVICVYTYDWRDKDDTMRIRDELRKLGFLKPMPYKADKDTHEEKYSVKGDTEISIYYL